MLGLSISEIAWHTERNQIAAFGSVLRAADVDVRETRPRRQRARMTRGGCMAHPVPRWSWLSRRWSLRWILLA
jgi:hypothetical protein